MAPPAIQRPRFDRSVAAVVTTQSSRSAVAIVGACSVEFEASARRALEAAMIPVGWSEPSQSGRALFLGVDSRDSVGALRCVHEALLAPSVFNDRSA